MLGVILGTTDNMILKIYHRFVENFRPKQAKSEEN